jgi:hypothetical protein
MLAWPSTPCYCRKVRQLLPPPLKSYVSERYLADARPAEIARELNEKFGHTITPAQLRQTISRSGLPARKQQLDAKVCGLVSSAKVTALAKVQAAAPAAEMAKIAERTLGLANKAVAMAEEATRPRELASATAALGTTIKLYRLMVGIDGAGSGGPRAATFNFGFAGITPTRVTVTEQSGQVEVSVTNPESPGNLLADRPGT